MLRLEKRDRETTYLRNKETEFVSCGHYRGSRSGGSAGLNAVGTQILDQQYWNSPAFGAGFLNAAGSGNFPSFSSGIHTEDLPEPSSMILLGLGLLAAANVVRRRLPP